MLIGAFCFVFMYDSATLFVSSTQVRDKHLSQQTINSHFKPGTLPVTAVACPLQSSKCFSLLLREYHYEPSATALHIFDTNRSTMTFNNLPYKT